MLPQMPPAGRAKGPSASPQPSPEPAAAPVAVPAHLRPLPGKPGVTASAPALVPKPKSPAPRNPAALAPTPAARQVTAVEEAAFAAIETEMGGRARLVSTLSTAQLPGAMERILGAIADPANDRISLARVCAMHDVSLAKLLDVFKSALVARGRLASLVRIASALPDVAAAVMDDALPGRRLCPKCLGARQVEEEGKDGEGKQTLTMMQCSRCKGIGEILFVPDHEVQKTALKIGGLLESGGMKVSVNQQTVALGGADSGSYDRLVHALDGAMYGHGRDRLRSAATADGEVLDGDSDG